MRAVQLLTWTTIAALFLTLTPGQADARTFVSVGFGFGGPCYGGWSCGPWGYYRPYPYYYGYYPPPVIYAPPAPLVVQQPTVIAPAPVGPVAPPAPAQPIYRSAAPAPSDVSTGSGGSIDHNLQLLSNASENTRQNAAMDLGRARIDQAVDPLCASLAGDTSPSVRDAAARALGLIGAQRSLPALIRAAQADNDRDVRHSAQFAVEIIRSNLRNR
jgi:hypothetical protein